MKKSLLFGTFMVFVLTSCENEDHALFLKIGSGLEFKVGDIELYDTSTHIIYFKNEYDAFKKLDKGVFIFFSNGTPIYSGTLWPGYSSQWPTDPYIMTPPMYGNHALRIGSPLPDRPDLRNNPGLIELLKRNNLLHSGLVISDFSVDAGAAQLSVRFTISNKDESDLLIIDCNKTGSNLFHYFTNGLYINDLANNEIFSGTIQPQAPDPWNIWKPDWLSLLKSGESEEFTIIYALSNPVSPGEYDARFEFPGLGNQVTKNELWQGNNRIWLGDIQIRKRIHIP